MPKTLATNTTPAMMNASRRCWTYPAATTSAVRMADWQANRYAQVEILLAVAMRRTVENSNTAAELRTFAAARSRIPIHHLFVMAVKMTAKIANAHATRRKSGTTYMRSFATLLSTIASPITRHASLTA